MASRSTLNFDLILQPPSKHYTLGRFRASELERTERVLGVKLPKAYIALVKKRNGARLRYRGVFSLETPKGHTGRAVYEFESIAGIHPTDSRGLTQATRLAQEEWGVPPGLVPIDGDGHWWLCLDYRECGVRGEPSITHFDTESNRAYAIEKSFTSLLRGLIRSDAEFIFALRDRALRGEKLDRLMLQIGCEQGRYRHPDTWDWPEYKGRVGRNAAYLAVHRNGDMSGRATRFPELPRSMPLLFVDVIEKDQARCVRRLVEAFGPKASLVHQPPDRRRFDSARTRRTVTRSA